jgi:hypothetical protein
VADVAVILHHADLDSTVILYIGARVYWWQNSSEILNRNCVLQLGT